MDPSDIRRYFVSYTNMLKIVEYRGCEVSKDYFLDYSSFMAKYGGLEDGNILKEKISGLIFENATSKIIVEWYNDKRIGIGIRDVVVKMEANNVKNALVVADNGINAGCKDMIKNIKATKHIIIDVWTLKESMVFVPDHVLVPKHRICSKQENMVIYKAYGIKTKALPGGLLKADMLPHIKTDDVMVKYLGATKGQLIEITRPSDTNPKLDIITYRLVV